MKGSDNFKKVIEAYLNNYAQRNPIFKERLEHPEKNIDDCVNYILNTVQKSGQHGFEDSEIYGMALHYYQEDNIEKPSKANSGSVVVNHLVELTEEEIQQAKQEARDRVIQEEMEKMRKKNSKKEEVPTQTTGTLF